MSVECVPRVVECLRLLATHSGEVSLSLLQHPIFLLALVGATLIFYEDMRMRAQASCLMALVVFQDMIGFSDAVEVGVTQLPSVPRLLADGLFLPFIHKTQPWVEDRGLSEEMRMVHHLLNEDVLPVQEFLGVVWGASQAGGMEQLSFDHCQDSKGPDCLLLSEKQVGWLRLSTLSLATASALRNVENATSHRDVVHNVAALSFRVQQLGLTGCWDEGFFMTHQWRGSFQRFLTAEPNSFVDEQLLIHVLECLCVCVQAHTPGLKQHQESCAPLIKLLVIELSNPSSAMHQILNKAGQTSWVACDYSVQTVQAVRLFRAAAGFVSCILSLVAKCGISSEVFGERHWEKLAAAVTTTLLPILTANNELQHYNLAVVGMALEVLLHVTLHGWPGLELSSHLVSNSIRVTLSSSLLLLHLFSQPGMDFTKDIQEASAENSMSWLVSLFVYRDPLVASCGLNVAAVMAAHTSLLHHSLTQVSGGVWAASLSYFLPEGRSCLVRTSAALLLVQLMQASPSPTSPWPSPVVADVSTGESVDGLEGLMALLQNCNFYSLVLTSLSHLNVRPVQTGVPPANQEWDLSLSCLSSFGPVDSVEEEESQGLTSIQLYEATLKLLVNLVLLSSDQVVPQLFSHGLLTLVITQLRFLLAHIKSSQPHLQAIEVTFVLLRAVLRHQPAQAATIARDTGLEHLALVVLAANLLPLASLEVLATLLAEGGWGAVRVVEWVVNCPSSILCPVIVALHASNPSHLQAAAASFLTGLTQVVLHSREASQQGLNVSLTGALDMQMLMPGGNALCPGWEICRHLIQLVCDTQPSQEPATLRILLLECLKLLLLVSQSARQAAFHLRPSLLPALAHPLQALQVKLTTVNLHISGNLLRCREVKVEVLASIQTLEVAANWVTGRNGVEDVCEALLGFLHRLWIPAQHTPSFLKALLEFFLSSTARHRCCVLFTRTTAMSGVSVSATRTRWPLLACVATLVCQQLGRLSGKTRNRSLCFQTLSRDNLDVALSVLINCARVPECVVVMNKLDMVGSSVKWLECRAALQEGVTITSRVLSLLVLLTTTKSPGQFYSSQGIGLPLYRNL
ncbi:Rotatin [Chionoecetes opilio]|uniref:Rotatin n=1 Tax=Chionoecetes opilio TaxID=41210 RepID=A0A8J4YE94_CHIOP|nr:Rotatin [Chionoecetes opilio]